MSIPTATSEPTLIILGIFTLVGSSVTAFFGYLAVKHSKTAREEARQANDAVNHRHEDQPRLFDMVAETHTKVNDLDKWVQQWADSPSGMDGVQAVSKRFDKVESTLLIVSEKLSDLAIANIEQHMMMAERIGSLDDRLTQIDHHTTPWDGVERRKSATSPRASGAERRTTRQPRKKAV